jgi:hypothetical protein
MTAPAPQRQAADAGFLKVNQNTLVITNAFFVYML